MTEIPEHLLKRSAARRQHFRATLQQKMQARQASRPRLKLPLQLLHRPSPQRRRPRSTSNQSQNQSPPMSRPTRLARRCRSGSSPCCSFFRCGVRSTSARSNEYLKDSLAYSARRRALRRNRLLGLPRSRGTRRYWPIALRRRSTPDVHHPRRPDGLGRPRLVDRRRRNELRISRRT